MAAGTGAPGMPGAVKGALAVLLSLTAATLALFNTGARFRTVKPGILANASFAHGLQGWFATSRGVAFLPGAPPTVVLTAVKGRGPAVLARPLPAPHRFTHLRVAAEIKADSVVPGVEPWQQAGLMVRSYGAAGAFLWYWPYEVATVSETTPWRRHEAVIPVAREVAAMYLLAYQAGESGAVSVRRLSVDAVTEAPWFRIARPVLLALWLAAGGAIGVAVVRRARPGRLGIGALVAGAVLVLVVLVPQPYQSNAVGWAKTRVWDLVAPVAEQARDAWRQGLAAVRPPTPAAAVRVPLAELAGHPQERFLGVPADALGHFIAFFGFALLVFLGFRRAPQRDLMLSLLVAAVATEALQAFTVTRTPQLHDAATNAAGILAAWSVIAAARRLRARVGAR